MEKMRQQLRTRYFLVLAPAVAGAAVAVLLRTPDWTLPLPWARAVFVAAVSLAAGLPLWLRAVFARRGPCPDMNRFCRFQMHLMTIALVPAYLALTAFVFRAPGFFTAGALLAALYGAYYFYPSSARLKSDLCIFRVDRERVP